MSQIINAVFENGVFKPLQQEKAKQYDAEEIEADIEQTIREVRAKKNGNQNS